MIEYYKLGVPQYKFMFCCCLLFKKKGLSKIFEELFLSPSNKI